MDYKIMLPSHIKVISEEENKGTYEIEGLYPGYGHTLGNSLRRILLSSLPGAAVTRAKIEGISHEFATMPGILEDVVTILLNLKQLRFALHDVDSATVTIDMKGIKEIKGKDIKCPTQVEVANKDQHIATLTDKNAHFSAELTVEKGIGFLPSEELVKDKVSVGDLVLDAIFTPIRRVNYEVENMRVGDRTDYNRLRLFVETDGTIAARDAIKQGLEILKQQFMQLEVFEDEKGSEAEEKESASAESDAFSEMKLAPRVKNALKSASILTPQELSGKTKEELLGMEGIGEKAVTDIKKALSKMGLSLKE